MDPEAAEPGARSSAITCVLAHDHTAPRGSLTRLLVEHGIDVVGEVADGSSALAAIAELKPRVAVLDAVMPELDGLEVVRGASLSSPTTATILYTAFADRDRLIEALNAGVRGFVLKEGPRAELIRAVSAVAAGQVYVDASLGATPTGSGAKAADTSAPELSAREGDILRLLGAGMTTKEIAGALFISPETVRTYIRRAMQKLEANTRTQAVAIAIRRSLIP
jgi:DNA-binding NarL/FixJ family response regulator